MHIELTPIEERRQEFQRRMINDAEDEASDSLRVILLAVIVHLKTAVSQLHDAGTIPSSESHELAKEIVGEMFDRLTDDSPIDIPLILEQLDVNEQLPNEEYAVDEVRRRVNGLLKGIRL